MVSSSGSILLLFNLKFDFGSKWYSYSFFKDTYQLYLGQKFCMIKEENTKPRAYKSERKQPLLNCLCSRTGILFLEPTFTAIVHYMPGAEGCWCSQLYRLSLHAYSSALIFPLSLIKSPSLYPTQKPKYIPCTGFLYGIIYQKHLNQIP